MSLPDLNSSIDNHHDKMKGWWRHPRHIAARKAQVAKHPFCSRCGRPASLILHEYPDDYQHGFEHYVSLIERGERPTGCPACNRMERSGRRPCPSCVEKYKKDPTVKIHYITQDQETCRCCEPGYDPEKSKIRKEQSARTKKDIGRNQYNRAHPTVKVPVNGKWVRIPRK